MVKKFIINLPDVHINSEQRIREIKAIFKNDFERGGSLTQSFIFCNLNEPASVTEIADHLMSYYKLEFQRTAVFRNLQRLQKIGLINNATSGEVMMMPENERTDVHRHIIAKYYKFLNKIPPAFRKNYTDINYFWIANGSGLEFIEWGCKILNFTCKVEDRK